MGCKKVVIGIVKSVAKEAGRSLVRFAVDAVGIIETASTHDPSFWTNDIKRKTAFDAIAGQANHEGRDLEARTVNLLVEFGVTALKSAVDESEIGIDDLATRTEV